MAAAGESGVTYTLVTGLPLTQLDTRAGWLLTVWVGRSDGTDTPREYPATASTDGLGAIWTNDATAWPIDPPASGSTLSITPDRAYNVELHCKKGSQLYKSRVQMLVSGAYGNVGE